MGDDVLREMGCHSGDEALAPVEPSEDQADDAVLEENIRDQWDRQRDQSACLRQVGSVIELCW